MVSKALISIKKNYGGLPRSIYILFIARIINRMGGFVYAFLAIYMKSKLNMSENVIADFLLLNGVLSMATPFIGGYIADKKGRKTIYVLAQAAGAAIFVVCGIVQGSHPELIPALLILASVINHMVGPINSAMVADIAKDPEERRRSYSLLYLGINVGVAIGPIIGGMLLENHTALFFIIDAVTTFISVILVALFVEETILTKEEMKAVKGNEKMEEGFALFVLFKKPVLLAFTVFAIFNSAVYAQSGFGFSLHLQHVFGSEFGAKYFGLLMSFNAILVLVFTIFITEILRKNKHINNIALASFLNMIGFGMIAFIGDKLPLFYVSVFVWTMAEIISVTNTSVFIMSHTPVNYRGRFNAIIDFLAGTGYVLSPKIMSYFMGNYSYETAWKFIAVIAFIGGSGLLITGFFDKGKEPLLEEKVIS